MTVYSIVLIGFIISLFFNILSAKIILGILFSIFTIAKLADIYGKL